MAANLTHPFRGRLGLLRKPAHALVGLIAVTAAALSLTAVPAYAASWHLKGYYNTSATCQAVGKAAVTSGQAEKYKCEGSSPRFALHLYY